VELIGERVRLRPVGDADVQELRRIHFTPEVARWWDEPGDGFPFDEPEAVKLVIEVAGVVGGMIQFGEEEEPRYRHASIDLFLDPALHGRGLGTEAILVLARHLVRERGHHRIVIDPSVRNRAAIRSYEKAGFRPVGVMRRYERDVATGDWADGLLMDLLADEL
jgi:aminoglycoside 6'-N-acetyltransferase